MLQHSSTNTPPALVNNSPLGTACPHPCPLLLYLYSGYSDTNCTTREGAIPSKELFLQHHHFSHGLFILGRTMWPRCEPEGQSTKQPHNHHLMTSTTTKHLSPLAQTYFIKNPPHIARPVLLSQVALVFISFGSSVSGSARPDGLIHKRFICCCCCCCSTFNIVSPISPFPSVQLERRPVRLLLLLLSMAWQSSKGRP